MTSALRRPPAIERGEEGGDTAPLASQPVPDTPLNGGGGGGQLMQPVNTLPGPLLVVLWCSYSWGGGGVERTIPLWGVQICRSMRSMPGGMAV